MPAFEETLIDLSRYSTKESKSMKYFIKRQLGMFWDEIRRRLIEENDRRLELTVKAFLAENMIFKPIIL